VTLVLYHAWASTCSQKVRLALAEKRLAYESRVLNLRRFEHLAPEFLALNPDGVVPVLVHDGFVARESTAINEYLDDAFPDPRLRPRDAIGRARVGMWTRFIDEVPTQAVKLPSFQRNLGPAIRGYSDAELAAALARMPNRETAERWRSAAREGIPQESLADADRKLRLTLERMEGALEKSAWLAGADYTLADANMTPFVHRMASFPEYALARWPSVWPRVADWYARVKARPSFAAAKLVEQARTLDQTAGA
jgi:glutathione S-transferase